MNVLKVYPSPEAIGGSEKSMHLAARALTGAGHNVYLLHSQGIGALVMDGFSDARPVPLLFGGRCFNVGRIKRELRELLLRWSIDVVHIHGFPRFRILKWLYRNYPTVISIHVPVCPNGARYFWKSRTCCARRVGLGCLTVGYFRKGCGHLSTGEPWSLHGFVRSMFEKWGQHSVLRQARFIIANSTWMKNQLVSENVAVDSIHVISPPILIVPQQIRSGKETMPVIVFTGRLVDFKGADQLLRASLWITQEHSIWIIGTGPAERMLRQLVIELKIADRVSFFGDVEGQELEELRSRATIAVVPSLSPETFGLVGPEAMELGLPVVAYRVGGISEWLLDGESGLLVDKGDFRELGRTLSKLIGDPARLEEMSKIGQTLSPRYYVSEHVKGLEGIYKAAIECSKASVSQSEDVATSRWSFWRM